MKRFADALQSFGSSNTLETTCGLMLEAIREAQQSNQDPCTDAAVMLLGTQVAFIIHADVITTTALRTILEQCQAQLPDVKVEILAPH